MKFTHARAHALLAPIPLPRRVKCKVIALNTGVFGTYLLNCYKGSALHNPLAELLMELLDRGIPA